MGGNSLLTARLQSLLRDKCHINLSTSSIYARPTIRGMADHQAISEKDQAIHDACQKLNLKGFHDKSYPLERDVTSPPVVLLTGSTGFLGLYLLASLQDKCKEIYNCCLCSLVGQWALFCLRRICGRTLNLDGVA